MSRIRPVYALAIVCLGLAACNFPVSTQQAQPSPDFVATSAAQTVEAQLTAAASEAVDTATPVPLPPSDTAAPPTQQPPSATSPAVTATNTQPATATQVPCDRAGFVRDVTVPDGTKFAPGATFDKTWRLKNNGSCTWDSNYSVIFVDGDAMGGPAAFTLTNGIVAPGAEVEVTVKLTAPQNEGDYRGNWKLRNPAGIPFGLGSKGDNEFWVDIEVVPPTATPNPTFTLSYVETHTCSGTDHAILQVVNTGNAALESVQITTVDTTGGTTLAGPSSSNVPFMRTSGECPPGGERVRTGQTRHVGANLGASPVSGNNAEATVRLCTLDNLGGTCKEEKISFIIP